MEQNIHTYPYSLALRPSIPADKNSEKKVYPVAQQNKTIGLRLMAKHIHEHNSAFSLGTILGVLGDLVACTVEMLQQGYSVNFDGLCRFYTTLSCAGADTMDDFNFTA